MKPPIALTLNLLAFAIVGTAAHAQTAEPTDPKATEQWEPVPKVITPGKQDAAPPSDSIVLFDGRDLGQWETSKDHLPPHWKVHDGVVTVDKASGNIQTRQHFRNYQLHLEWQVPKDITGEGQARGNSGALPRLHRAWRRGLRGSDPRFVQQQDLCQRPGRQHLQAGAAAGQCHASAGRMAKLRRRVDSAGVRRRWLAEITGLRDRAA